MTNEQILELAKTCGFGTYTDDDGTPSDYFDCYAEQLLKFAQKMYIKGYIKGKDEGYEEGWKSCDVSTKMNTWSSDYD
jgi:hypothetical protein